MEFKHRILDTAKELASSHSPESWPMVGSFPGHRAGNWREAGHLSSSAAVSIGLDIPTRNYSLTGSRNKFIPTVRGRQGQASKSGLLHLGAPQEFLSPQKGGLWLLF